jgi:metal transporter CNNM
VPLDQVFMLSKKDTLDQGTLADILAKGFSRVPVYDGSKHNVCGLLLVKRLIVIDPSDERVIETLYTRKPSVVGLSTTLLDALNEFQSGRSHLAIVCNKPDVVRKCVSVSYSVSALCTLNCILSCRRVLIYACVYLRI